MTCKRHAKTSSASTPNLRTLPSAVQVLTVWERRVVMGAVVIQTGAGVGLQARSGQMCCRRVKLSSHYHADTEANKGGSICSCQWLQIWCHPVHWRQQATPSNEKNAGIYVLAPTPTTHSPFVGWRREKEAVRVLSSLETIVICNNYSFSHIHCNLTLYIYQWAIILWNNISLFPRWNRTLNKNRCSHVCHWLFMVNRIWTMNSVCPSVTTPNLKNNEEDRLQFIA